jgi:hypothetical protein
MNGWNYRVVKRDEGVSLHEAYYNDKGEVNSISVEPVSPTCEGLDELRATLHLMLASLDKPIININDLDHDATIK